MIYLVQEILLIPFSSHVKPNDRKWLIVMWKGQLFHIPCLPQGRTFVPLFFTQLLKPLLSHMQKLGISMLCYIDDCVFIASLLVELRNNVIYALQLFVALGLTFNDHRSVLIPTQKI